MYRYLSIHRGSPLPVLKAAEPESVNMGSPLPVLKVAVPEFVHNRSMVQRGIPFTYTDGRSTRVRPQGEPSACTEGIINVLIS